MNGLVTYDSSGSENDEPVQKMAKVSAVPKLTTTTQQSSTGRILGGSILASEYQLRMLSKQRSKAARDGSKKRIFITAPNLEDLEEPEDRKIKPKQKKSSKQSMLFAALPKPIKSSNQMSSKLSVQPMSSNAERVQPTKSLPLLMPNSVKKRLETKNEPKKVPNSSLPTVTKDPTVANASDSEGDSDGECGYFNFNSKEEDAEELKQHMMNDVGPTRPTRDMLRKEREKFVGDETETGEDHIKYSTTRHPDSSEVEDSAIAPYGHDLAGYHAIAGPIRRQSVHEESDAGLDIESEAIRKLQGRRHEEVTFIDAKVDKSLGNIRENIRKGANQKHISTSIVDPLKDMKKTDPNAHVSKRTHQLKYLVELAKANETRLNQLWSNAKSSSRTTAQKYGW